MRHLLEYVVVRGMEALERLLPRRAALLLAGLLGRAWFLLDVHRRELAIENLERAFGQEMTPGQRRAVARNAFRTLSRSLIDVLGLESWDGEKISRLVTIEGWEWLEAAYHRGKGVLLFSGHIGCWELVPHIQALKGLKINLVVRPLDNPRLDDLLDRKRRASGNEIITKRRAVRSILRALRRGEGVAIVIDQNLRSPERIFVDFFGHPAATTPALALAARRTEAAVVPVFCIPRPDGSYLIRYHRPVAFPPVQDHRVFVRELTQECTRLVEETIREHPEAWLWMHRRWRTSPEPGDTSAGQRDTAGDMAASG